jgi:hypothetical protein
MFQRDHESGSGAGAAGAARMGVGAGASPAAAAADKKLHNDPRLLPPRFDEREVMSSLKLDHGAKERFNRIEVGEALTVLERKLSSQALPKPLVAAVLRFVDDAVTVSVPELRKRFAEFTCNKEEVDTGQAMDALAKCLNRKHKCDLLHSSLLEYTDFTDSGPPRPTPYEEKPVTSEPWGRAVVQAKFGNMNLPFHDENPFNGRLFDPALLKSNVP